MAVGIHFTVLVPFFVGLLGLVVVVAEEAAEGTAGLSLRNLACCAIRIFTYER